MMMKRAMHPAIIFSLPPAGRRFGARIWIPYVLAALAFGACSHAPASPQQQAASAHTNRLASESSPYLLQHAHNPVDWYPWGEEAMERARKENRPIFLSVGYAACHWCHVMERESFENEETAKLLNASFVCIKVDREERPDLDDVYMNAVQLTTGRGGWPMSVFLTPEGKPFFGGTYFPPDDFRKLLVRVAETWKARRADVDKSANAITEALARQARLATASSTLAGRDVQTELLASLRDSFDSVNGGFGKAPKFPPHNALPFLFYVYEKAGEKDGLSLALGTLDAIARGGIRDHLGGGFHRYSTDVQWKLPHFEKMLYDNALLARAYVDAYRLTGKPLYSHVARETLDWALREMRGPEGGFYSSLDADSAGEEGRYYVWSLAQIADALGATDARTFADVYGVRDGGNYEEQATGAKTGKNVLFLAAPLAGIVMKRGPAFAAKLDRLRIKLLEVRAKRVRPSLDDKRLTSWNALMIGSLAYAGRVLKEPRYSEAAGKTADFLLKELYRDGRLYRRWRPAAKSTQNQTSSESKRGRDVPAFLDDYAYLLDALLDLRDADPSPRWVQEAERLAAGMIAQFADPAGGFFDTPKDHETLIVRSHNVFDNALPSANAVAGRALLRLARLKNDTSYLLAGGGALKTGGSAATRAPTGAETMTLVTLQYLDTVNASATDRPPSKIVKGPVTVYGIIRKTPEGATLLVTVQVKEGWHINSNRPLDPALIPTSIRVTVPSGLTAGAIRYPQARTVKLGFSAEPVSVYTGAVRIELPVAGRQPAAGSPDFATIRVRFQACDDRACLAPETAVVAVAIPR